MSDMRKPYLDEEDGEEKEGQGGNPLIAKMLATRTVLASEPVSDKLARRVIGELLILEQEDPDRPITVIVNSPGGSADCGFAIYDSMRFVRCPIRTITMGMCASAGVMIHLGGDKGQRFVTPTARFLLHQPSMSTMGAASDLEIVSKEIDRIKLVYNRIVAEATGRSIEQINKDVNRDFWLHAEAGVEYGLADRMVTSRQEIE